MQFKLSLTLLMLAVFCVVGIFGRSEPVTACKRIGFGCNDDSECCNNAVCHRYAKQCQVKIDAQMLQNQHDRLRHTSYNRQLIQPAVNNACKQHGMDCVSDSECCNNAVCHRFAHRCQIPIDAQMLQEQRNRLRHVDNKYSIH